MSAASLDIQLFYFINRDMANGLCDAVMPFLSNQGYMLIFPYLAVLLWIGYGRRKADGGAALRTAIWSICLALAAFLLTDWLAGELKKVIARPRPCRVLEGIHMLAGCSASGSMPSNHAANSLAYALPLYYMTKDLIGPGWRLYPIVLAGFVGLSRIFLGVHYPSDVAGGFFFGANISFMLMGIFFAGRRHYAQRPHETILFAVLFALSIFRIYYVLRGPIDLSPDEAQYWDWARHLDISYYSKGPMIAYLIHLGTLVFGNTEFGVRWLAIVFSAASSLLLYRLAKDMTDDKSAALASALLFQAIPLFSAFGVVFTIDGPFVFFWILSLYLFYKAFRAESTPESERRKGLRPLSWWICFGISLGLGLLTKYTMALFYPCAAAFLLWNRGGWMIFRRPGPVLSAVISAIVFSPVIIWNSRHEWVTLRHTAGQANVAEGFAVSIRTFLEFLGSQAGLVTPIVFGMMAYALYLLWRKRDETAKYLFCFSVPVILFFLLKSIQGKVQANWAMTGYLTAIIAVSISYFLSLRPTVARSTKARIVIVSGICIAVIVTAAAHFSSYAGLPPKLDPSSRLRGWEQTAREVSALARPLRAEGDPLIVSDRYQIAAELSFYMEGQPQAYCINLGRRMNQYDLWPGLNEAAAKMRQTEPERRINGVLVMNGDNTLPAEVASAFDSCEKKVVRVHEKGELLRVSSVFICYNFSGLEARPIDKY